MGHRPRAALAPGLHQRATGEVVAYFNLRIQPAAKRRLLLLAARLGRRPGDLVLEALYAAHPSLRPKPILKEKDPP